MTQPTLPGLTLPPKAPHMLAVSSLRPRWGGPGGAGLTSGDTCGSVLCVWGLGPTKTHTVIHGLGDWRPRGRG